MTTPFIEEAFKAFMEKDKVDFELAQREEYGTPFTICTNCCTWLIDTYFPEGTTIGYWTEDNPEALVASQCGGHDFLIVGDYLVDFWNRGIELVKDAPILLHLDREKDEVRKWYGNPDTWRTLDNITLKEIRKYATNSPSNRKIQRGYESADGRT